MASYPVFNQYVERLRGRLVQVPMTERWQADLEGMAARVGNRTRLVYLCNPNNPTGTFVDPQQLRRFCEDMGRRCVVFVDEAYYELVEDARRTSMVELVREGSNLIVGRTFSKIYGLAGLRIGYGIGDPSVIAEMGRIQRVMAQGNQLSIAAARAAYADTDYVDLSRRRNAEARAGFYGLLEKLGYPAIPDSQANFVSFRTRGGEKRLTADLREKYGIHVHGTRFLEREWIRVSMGTPAEMERLAAALGELA